jgi:RNA recognition motif-containing protein
MFQHYQIKSSPSSFVTPTHNLYNLQSFNPSTITTNRQIQAHNLYISNLSLQTTEESLFQTVAQYGQVTHVCILSTLDSQGR